MNQSKNACRLCLQDKNLIKAHIIPEGFFRLLRHENIAPVLHSNTPGSFPKRMQVGTYDSTILCSECDGKMAPWDDYGQQILIRQFPEAIKLSLQGKTVAWEMEKFDYRRLKLFFMSVLWRASVSKQTFYKRISIGPFEDRLRTMILNEDPGDTQEFVVVLARFEDVEITAMLDPHPEKFDGISFCRFYLSGFVAYIKVDQRPTPSFLTDLRLQEGRPLVILARSVRNSPDGRVMRELAERALSHQENRKRRTKL
ncbi:MAG: hypothetical protein RI101_10165 [Nitrospira sp.]|jgi:hypothetical protein|nr:hypothetical protein [Nitrospira sp.]